MDELLPMSNREITRKAQVHGVAFEVRHVIGEGCGTCSRALEVLASAVGTQSILQLGRTEASQALAIASQLAYVHPDAASAELSAEIPLTSL